MVERHERKWIWWFALITVLVTSVPYLLGYFQQGDSWQYTGFVFGVEDGNSYIAKMLRGANGDWLFRTPFTPYEQRGALFLYTFFLLLGKLTAPPGQHEQMVAVYHLFRAVSIVLYLFASYDFLAVFIREIRWRRLGASLAAFGGGLGWLSILGLGSLWNDTLPLDFYSPEAFGFLMLYGLPHLACARALLLWGLRAYLTQSGQPGAWRWQSLLRTALIWFGIAFFQPITAVVGWAVIGAHVGSTAVWQVWLQKRGGQADWGRWKEFFTGALRTGLLSLPLVGYTLLSFQLDPFLSSWQSQNRITSPVFTHYLLAYGIVLPLVVFGAAPLLRERPWQGWLVVAWAAVTPILVYAPVTVQRRLAEGVWVALLVIALYWLEQYGGRQQRWARAWLVLSYLPALFLLVGGAMAAARPDLPLFRPRDEVAVFRYLAAQGRFEDIVLASFDTSNPLPAWAPVRTITGHGPESMHGEQLRARVDCFYRSDCGEKERSRLLGEFGVDYVVWGPEERALGEWDPRTAAYLQPVLTEGKYRLFAVDEARLP